MAVIAYTNEEVKLLARLMRAEAESEGDKGMLMVGNVCINRALARCIEFKKIKTIKQAVMQKPGGFEATSKSYFYQGARQNEIKLAKRIINGEKVSIASYALWFYNPYKKGCKAFWYGWNTGRYKSHCFYKPEGNLKCF